MDLQRIIIEFTQCFSLPRLSLFKNKMIDEREKQDLMCYWWCRQFYNKMWNTYLETMIKFEIELLNGVRDILLSRDVYPAYFIEKWGYYPTSYPIKRYLESVKMSNTMPLIDKYVTHKYSCF